MGINQHNAGIHIKPYHHNTDGIRKVNKYDEMIAEGKFRQDKRLIEDVELCNFCVIIPKKGSKKKCICGGTYNYAEKIPVKYHNKNKMHEVFVTGKLCKDCGRKLLVTDIVLSVIYKEINKGDNK